MTCAASDGAQRSRSWWARAGTYPQQGDARPWRKTVLRTGSDIDTSPPGGVLFRTRRLSIVNPRRSREIPAGALAAGSLANPNRFRKEPVLWLGLAPLAAVARAGRDGA
jgi:hypothetical protein